MPICNVEGCDRTVKARGWCDMHYHRWVRHGSTDVVLPNGHPGRAGVAHPRWKGDDAGKRAVHLRLETAYGKASLYDCATCGAPAKEWAFNEPTGFSHDLSRYRPLCFSCHKFADRPAATVR